MSKKPRKLYAIRNKRGVSGVFFKKPLLRKQDAKFRPDEFWAVVFFPRLTQLGPARLWKDTLVETLSASREAAITKFMDRGVKSESETWENYRRAGWKVRRIRVSDLGDRPSKRRASA